MVYQFQDSEYNYHRFKTIKAARKAAYTLSNADKYPMPYQIHRNGINIGTVHGNIWKASTKILNRYGETTYTHKKYILSPDGTIRKM